MRAGSKLLAVVLLMAVGIANAQQATIDVWWDPNPVYYLNGYAASTLKSWAYGSNVPLVFFDYEVENKFGAQFTLNDVQLYLPSYVQCRYIIVGTRNTGEYINGPVLFASVIGDYNGYCRVYNDYFSGGVYIYVRFYSAASGTVLGAGAVYYTNLVVGGRVTNYNTLNIMQGRPLGIGP